VGVGQAGESDAHEAAFIFPHHAAGGFDAVAVARDHESDHDAGVDGKSVRGFDQHPAQADVLSLAQHAAARALRFHLGQDGDADCGSQVGSPARRRHPVALLGFVCHGADGLYGIAREERAVIRALFVAALVPFQLFRPGWSQGVFAECLLHAPEEGGSE
jgi:hypothetical protein